MSVTTEGAVDASIVPPAATISYIAAEIIKLHAAFDEKATDLTSAYISQQLEGKEGETWEMFPRSGLFARPTPYLARIMRNKGAILLGAGFNHFNDLLWNYRLTKTSTLTHGTGNTFVRADAITVRQRARGFDPGAEFIVIGDQVLKAGYDHHRSVPTVQDGHFAWSIPRDFVNGTFVVMTEVDERLKEVFEALRLYNPAVTPTT